MKRALAADGLGPAEPMTTGAKVIRFDGMLNSRPWR